MPRFYFNVFDDDVTIDDEGQTLPGVDAARAVAIRSARELICADLREGRLTLSHRIEVEDEERRPVLSLTYGEAVRVNP